MARALRSLGHRCALVDSFLGIPDGLFCFTCEDSGSLPELTEEIPDLAALRNEAGSDAAGEIGPGVIAAVTAADITFNALHGGNGENGVIQGFFDMLGVRYTGDGYLASALAMHKDVARLLFAQAGVPTAPGAVYDAGRPEDFSWPYGYPCIVKPSDGGSSIGLVKADDEKALLEALKNVQDETGPSGTRFVVEKFIPGREFAVGVLGGEPLPVIEITPNQGLYDYRNKYQAGRTLEVCPAPLPDAATKLLQETAVRACEALGIRVCARGELILDEEGHVYCLEMNTLPGMTPTSLLPQEAAAAGLDFPALCERIVLDSMHRDERR